MKKCCDCAYWQAKTKKEDLGDCRKSPPVAVFNETDNIYMTRWPLIDHDGWCGEFLDINDMSKKELDTERLREISLSLIQLTHLAGRM